MESSLYEVVVLTTTKQRGPLPLDTTVMVERYSTRRWWVGVGGVTERWVSDRVVMKRSGITQQRWGTLGNAWERWGTLGNAGERLGTLGNAWERWGTLGNAWERLGTLGNACCFLFLTHHQHAYRCRLHVCRDSERQCCLLLLVD
jgi:hypothetical protein